MEHTAEIEVNFKKMKLKPITPFKNNGNNYRELYGDNGMFGGGYYQPMQQDPYYGSPSRLSPRRSPTRGVTKWNLIMSFNFYRKPRIQF